MVYVPEGKTIRDVMRERAKNAKDLSGNSFDRCGSNYQKLHESKCGYGNGHKFKTLVKRVYKKTFDKS